MADTTKTQAAKVLKSAQGEAVRVFTRTAHSDKDTADMARVAFRAVSLGVKLGVLADAINAARLHAGKHGDSIKASRLSQYVTAWRTVESAGIDAVSAPASLVARSLTANSGVMSAAARDALVATVAALPVEERVDALDAGLITKRESVPSDARGKVANPSVPVTGASSGDELPDDATVRNGRVVTGATVFTLLSHVAQWITDGHYVDADIAEVTAGWERVASAIAAQSPVETVTRAVAKASK